jgi:VanZ family protein
MSAVRLDAKFAAITVGIIAVIVYGSLYPFRFYDNPDPDGPLSTLLTTWNIVSGRGDLLANFVLYLPLGFFWVRSSKPPSWYSLLGAVAAGISLSTTMELLQFYDIGRYSEMSDIYMNTAGTIVGAAAGIFSQDQELLFIPAFHRNDPVILLLTSWLGYRLFPYAPVIDLHKYWDAVKPLVLTPSAPAVDVYRHVVTWFAVSLMLEMLFGIANARYAATLLFVGVLLLRIVILDAALSVPEVVGGAVGVTLWIAVLSRLPSRATIVAGLFIIVVVLQALEPFQFNHAARPFGWIPFRSFFYGSTELAVPSFFDKIFTYGCLVWLLEQTGCLWVVATISGAILVFILRLIQVYLPGRSAEITDVILLVSVAIVMRLLRDDAIGNLPYNRRLHF